jgi:hypothetical protein
MLLQETQPIKHIKHFRIYYVIMPISISNPNLDSYINASKVYTLQQKDRTLSVVHKKRNYVIGFKNVTTARKVHYFINPEPKLLLICNEYIEKQVEMHNQNITIHIDPKATLFIPKMRGSFLDPMNDANFHMSHHKEDEFLRFPFEKNLGIIMPYELFEESDDEFIFKAVVVDPII